MKAGELKTLVLKVLNLSGQATVREVLNEINLISDKIYKYTTIATILSRLEKENIITSEKKTDDKRSTKYYKLEETAHKKEVHSLLKSLFSKFGTTGVRHLADVLDSDITEEELEIIRKKLF